VYERSRQFHSPVSRRLSGSSIRWSPLVAAAILAAAIATPSYLRADQYTVQKGIHPRQAVRPDGLPDMGPARITRLPASPQSCLKPDSWVTLKAEDFEGSFPNDWTLSGTPTWDAENYRHNGGSKSGYCVGSTISPPGPYPPNANARMVYGPFSLEGAVDARVDFSRWLETEEDFDRLRWLASIDGATFYGFAASGSQDSWQSVYFDLKSVPTLGNLCGQPEVWIAFAFTSNVSQQYEGAYIDDITVRKRVSFPQPNLAPFQPTGWDAPIVPSNDTGTHILPGTLYSGTSYVDMAVANAGTQATSARFYTWLYVDGVPVASGYVDPPLDTGCYATWSDIELSISAGPHVLSMFVDSTNAIAESDEDDNRYARRYIWRPTGGGPYEHVTITDSLLAPSFAPLKTFLMDYLSLHDTVITADDIYAAHGGLDSADRVRNFIKYAYQNWQTRYVLLGGGADVVPHRMAVSGHRPEFDTIPCDLYFSDLDGTWDANGNSVYGEPTDGVDMFPDVYVGRAPVSSSAEAQLFVNKTVTYGSTGSPPHATKVLLAGFDLDTLTYTEQAMEFYDTTYIDSAFTCAKVYDSQQGNHGDSVKSFLNQGQHIFIHSDHGTAGAVGCGWVRHGWSLSNSDMAGLTNGLTQLTVFMSLACDIGAFDEGECVMGAFMNAPGGGAVAAMSNSRAGWYVRGENPQRSLSSAFIEKSVQRIFGHRPALMHDFLLGKADMVPQASAYPIYRHCMYTLNLFGEPALSMPTASSAIAEGALPDVGQGFLTAEPKVFSRATNLRFTNREYGKVRVDVFDASGRLVDCLLNSDVPAGRHSLAWNGRTLKDQRLSSGVYLVVLRSSGRRESCKVVLR
jgi:hypothetical protein